MKNSGMSDRTVVFDLDDTLYAEADYVLSGKKALSRLVHDLFDVDIRSEIESMDTGFLEYITAKLKGDVKLKESLLWAYRTHQPTIALRPGAERLMKALKQRGDRLAVITDGRSVTQRLKIAALKLDVDTICISDEVGAEKPDPAAFLAVEQRCPANAYVYVGDNIMKDFVVPRSRGWLSIGLKHDDRAIHKVIDPTRDNVEPDIWVDDLGMLHEILLEP